MIGLQRNLKLYPWYVGLFHAYFWLPIYFLFFNSKLALSDVLYLASIYFASVVIIEVPSGWFSDQFGRRKTLIVASVFLCVAYTIFLFADSFGTFVTAQVFLAAGIAFNSGTDTSFLFETTDALGTPEAFPEREANAMKFNFLGTAIAGILGGLAAIPDFRGAYLLSLLAGIGLLIITFLFIEPQQKTSRLHTGFFKQVIACLALLKNTYVLWLFAFAIFMIIINHIPYEFYQPYLKELASQYEAIKVTPFLTSVHLTLTMLAASWIADRSIRIRNTIGTVPTLLSAAGLQIVMMATMSFFVSIPAAIVTLLRSCPRALMTAPLNAEVAPRIPTEKRATFFSLQSLFGRLGFSITLFLFGSSAANNDWASISKMLEWGMWLGLVGFVALLLTRKLTPS
ncbi:MAG: MFS transporter [Phycisphaerales bacterium]|jgi:MFS family permease|nr:MFS transporter [Phycisphaerales bacterium]